MLCIISLCLSNFFFFSLCVSSYVSQSHSQWCRNTYIISEIIFDLLLIFSFQIFLLNLIFADHAFACVNRKEMLICAEQFIKFFISLNCEQLFLLLNLVFNDVSFFCQLFKILINMTISSNKSLSYSTFKLWMTKTDALMRFKQILHSYSFWYDADKTFNNSSMFLVFILNSWFSITDIMF